MSLPFLQAEQWELASPVQPNPRDSLHLRGIWNSRGKELHLCVVNGRSCPCAWFMEGAAPVCGSCNELHLCVVDFGAISAVPNPC